MRKIGASSTLTVYHDGQFWVGTFERVEDEKLSVCKVVFGGEPSAEEIQGLVCKQWNQLRFTRAIELESAIPKTPSNPKRRQREASRELAQLLAETRWIAQFDAASCVNVLERTCPDFKGLHVNLYDLLLPYADELARIASRAAEK